MSIRAEKLSTEGIAVSKRDKFKSRIFKHPTVADIGYQETVAWFRGQGAQVDESRSGSRFFVEWEGQTLGLHRPHGKGGNVLPKWAVEDVREFIEKVESAR